MRVPRVPTPADRIPTDNREVRHDINLNAPMQRPMHGDAFSGRARSFNALAAGMRDMAAEGAKVIQQLQNEQDQADAREAYAKLSERVDAHLYGNAETGTPGVYALKGKNSFNAVTDTKDMMVREVATASKNLSQSAARMFDEKAFGLRASVMRGVAGHVGSERRTYALQTLVEEAGVEGRLAMDSHADPRQREDAITRMQAALYSQADMQGLDKTTAKQSVDRATSATLGGVFGRMVEARQFEAAKQLFDDPRFSEEDKRKAAPVYRRALLDEYYADARLDPDGTYAKMRAELGLYENNGRPPWRGAPRRAKLPPAIDAAAADEAARQNVDPALVTAVIAQESGGKADAVSVAGARGPMQLMPATARGLGVDIDDPAQNIRGGVTYLKQQLDRFGDTRLALAAYNWGPENVASWLANGHGVKTKSNPTGAMPKETRDYVSRILGANIMDLHPENAPAAPAAPAGGQDGEATQHGLTAASLLDIGRADKVKIMETAESLAIAKNADNLALRYLDRVKEGENREDVRAEILALDPKMRGPVNQLFTAHHADWRNTVREQSLDDIVALRTNLASMTLGQAYTAIHGLAESTPREQAVKKQMLADYAVMAQHGGLNRTTDPDKFAAIVDGILHGEVTSEKELRSHVFAPYVAEKDMAKLARDLAGASTVKERDLKVAYRWSIGKDENNPKAGSLTRSENQDFMKFSAWAQEMTKKTNRAGDADYVKNLARIWRMSGEKRGGGWGYGSDARFSQAADDPTWLPDLRGEALQEINMKFAENPALARAWAARNGNNMSYAKRAYYRKLLFEGIGPRQRDGSAPIPVDSGQLYAGSLDEGGV